MAEQVMETSIAVNCTKQLQLVETVHVQMHYIFQLFTDGCPVGGRWLSADVS